MDPEAYQLLLKCIFSNDINVCDRVPSGAGRPGHARGKVEGARLVNPLGGGGHQVDGADRCVCTLGPSLDILYKVVEFGRKIDEM